MANNTVINFDPGDGVRAVVKSDQSLLTLAGADTIARLTILGRIGATIGTATADGSNTGNGTVTSYALASGGPAKTGSYILTCTVAGLTHGGTFKVVDPQGVDIGTFIMPDGAGGTYVFEGGGIVFTVTDGSTNFAVDDFFTLTITAGSGYYAPYAAAGVDGREIPVAISLSAVVATIAGDFPLGVLLAGNVNDADIIIDGSLAGVGITQAIKDSLRTFGIYAETITETAALDNQT